MSNDDNRPDHAEDQVEEKAQDEGRDKGQQAQVEAKQAEEKIRTSSDHMGSTERPEIRVAVQMRGVFDV